MSTPPPAQGINMPPITVPSHQYLVKYHSIAGQPTPTNGVETTCYGGIINLSPEKYAQLLLARREKQYQITVTCPGCGNRQSIEHLNI